MHILVVLFKITRLLKLTLHYRLDESFQVTIRAIQISLATEETLRRKKWTKIERIEDEGKQNRALCAPPWGIIVDCMRAGKPQFDLP